MPKCSRGRAACSFMENPRVKRRFRWRLTKQGYYCEINVSLLAAKKTHSASSILRNIMLVSVTERTFEVGLRKALGATKKQILLQFLIESALLCIVGGLIGLLLAFGATQLIASLAGMTMTITALYLVGSVAVSSIIGIIAGLYPAWKAARLDPIVALTQS